MAKKKAVHRKLIPYSGELRVWLGIRLDPEYRRFFDAYAERFLDLVYLPVYDPFEPVEIGGRPNFKRDKATGKPISKRGWKNKTGESVAQLSAARIKLIKVCRKKWGLLKPIDYRDIQPNGRILVNGPAQVAQHFLNITGPKVKFQIDLTYTHDEIVEAFSAELARLRRGVEDQNEFGYKRGRRRKYTKIQLPASRGRNKSISTLVEWSRAYELKHFCVPEKTNEQISVDLENELGRAVSADTVSDWLLRIPKYLPSLKKK